MDPGFFKSKLFLCKKWPMHVLLKISLFEHKILHISFMRDFILVTSDKLLVNINN